MGVIDKPNKTVLVTGGTGSFGNFITRELLKSGVNEVRIFSRDEEKQLKMSRKFEDERLKFIIGNVRDYERVLEATTGVDILYHAAALKIIPYCERHPVECLKTNILGTLNVKRAASECGVQNNIFISTDKASKPVNMYGMTKAVGEKIWLNKEFGSTSKFAVVRYGNVVGSRGSVVPYFRELVEKGEPLPVTHNSMTRFLITLQQAINLVFYATEEMDGGEIFVPDIPACKIVDLVEAIGGEKYPIKLSGVRPGEKIHECLIQEDEFRRIEKAGEYYVIHPYGKYECPEVRKGLTSQNARQLSVEEVRELLKEVT